MYSHSQSARRKTTKRRVRLLRGFVASLAFLPVCAAAAPTAGEDYLEVLTLAPDAANGAELFTQCAECHGDVGAGIVDGTTPRIAGQHYRVLVKQLLDFRHGLRIERQGSRGIGDGKQTVRGQRVYAARCASCHGRAGEGMDSQAVPRVAGQHAAYLLRQAYDALDGRRPKLGGSHNKLLAPLSTDEMLALTDYLSRLGWHSEEKNHPKTP